MANWKNSSGKKGFRGKIKGPFSMRKAVTQNTLVRNPTAIIKRDIVKMKSTKGKADQINLIGRELVVSGGAIPTSATGNLIDSFGLNPTQLRAPRLAAISALFEKFYFNKLTFHLVLDQASTATGGCIGFWEDDSTFLLKAPPPTQLASIANSKSGKIMQYAKNEFRWNIDKHLVKEKMMGHVENFGRHVNTLGHSAEESFQGIFALVTYLTAGSGYAYNIYISYNVDMWDAISSNPALIPLADASISVVSIIQTLNAGNDTLFPNTIGPSAYQTFGPALLSNAPFGNNYNYYFNQKGYYWLFVHVTGTAVSAITVTLTASGPTVPTVTQPYAFDNLAAAPTTTMALVKVDCSAFTANDFAYYKFIITDTTVTSYSIVAFHTAQYPSTNVYDEFDHKVQNALNTITGRVPADSLLKINKIKLLGEDKNGFHYQHHRPENNSIASGKIDIGCLPFDDDDLFRNGGFDEKGNSLERPESIMVQVARLRKHVRDLEQKDLIDKAKGQSLLNRYLQTNRPIELDGEYVPVESVLVDEKKEIVKPILRGKSPSKVIQKE